MSPILVTNKAGTILWVNEEVCRLVNCTAEDLTDTVLVDYLEAPSGAELQQRLERVSGPGEVVYYDGTFTSLNGEKITLEFRIYPVVELETQEFLYHVSIGTTSSQLRQDGGAVKVDEFRRTYEHTSLSFTDGERLFVRTEAIVRAQKLFLDPNFSLDEAAHRLATNQLYLSQAINFFAGSSFRNYVNHKRFNYLYLAQEGPKRSKLTVEELWQMAGFGSYSTFRRYLKQERGMTPKALVAELRQQLSD